MAGVIFWSVVAGFFSRLFRWAGFGVLAVTAARQCPHERVVRYWFRKHYFQRVCKDCEVVIERGRDKSHRYPEGAEGVERGARLAQ